MIFIWGLSFLFYHISRCLRDRRAPHTATGDSCYTHHTGVAGDDNALCAGASAGVTTSTYHYAGVSVDESGVGGRHGFGRTVWCMRVYRRFLPFTVELISDPAVSAGQRYALCGGA